MEYYYYFLMVRFGRQKKCTRDWFANVKPKQFKFSSQTIFFRLNLPFSHFFLHISSWIKFKSLTITDNCGHRLHWTVQWTDLNGIFMLWNTICPMQSTNQLIMYYGSKLKWHRTYTQTNTHTDCAPTVCRW